MARITGIGGVFFKSTGDGSALAAWYRTHFELATEAWGGRSSSDPTTMPRIAK